MTDIGPEDWVECVDASLPRGWWCGQPPVLGAIYRVDRLWVCRWNLYPVVSLVGFPRFSMGLEWGYGLFRFRPIRDEPKVVTREAKRDVSVKEHTR